MGLSCEIIYTAADKVNYFPIFCCVIKGEKEEQKRKKKGRYERLEAYSHERLYKIYP